MILLIRWMIWWSHSIVRKIKGLSIHKSIHVVSSGLSIWWIKRKRILHVLQIICSLFFHLSASSVWTLNQKIVSLLNSAWSDMLRLWVPSPQLTQKICRKVFKFLVKPIASTKLMMKYQTFLNSAFLIRLDQIIVQPPLKTAREN